MKFLKNCSSNFGVINSLLTPSHKFFDYFIKREKKATKSEKKATCNLFIEKLRLNRSLTMFTQALCEAIKRFQSHFPKDVIYVEKEVTVDLDFFSYKIF